MKNKIFKNLSMEKKQNTLLHILRNKTNRLLNEDEEAAILNVGMKRKQFRISVYNDISAFAKAMDNTESPDYEVIFGEDAVKELRINNTLVDSSIAVFASVVMNDRAVQQLLIYIPETRKCKYECVREKYICEHIECYGVNTLCCDLQRVQA